MNSVLHGETPDEPWIRRQIDNLSGACQTCEAPADYTVYRMLTPEQFDRPLSTLVGTRQLERGFMSVSLLPDPPELAHLPVRLALRLPTGAPAMWMMSPRVSPFPEEQEIVLDKGACFEVTSVRCDPKTARWHVSGRLLGWLGR